MKNSLFVNLLMVVIGLLMLVAALQLFGWGKGTSMLEPEAFDVSTLPQLEQREGEAEMTGPEDLVDQITLAPLFNLDRKPYVGELEQEVPPEVVDNEKAEPLKAQVTGIMILGEEKYAMVLDQISNEKVTLEQGMPLPGEQGLWVVDQIEPRLVTFVSEGEEPVILELEVFDGTLNNNVAQNNKRNKNNRNRNNKNTRGNAKKEPVEQKNSAEEIRRKIAERRAQMRANAANKGNK
jgi:hypothetical protein